MDSGNLHGIGDKRDSDITLEMLDYKFITECNNIKVRFIL